MAVEVDAVVDSSVMLMGKVVVEGGRGMWE
jgi:hypothetical protein